ncbi:MAG: hypothetical protein U0744_01430 [Gemmataceae bacterium]
MAFIRFSLLFLVISTAAVHADGPRRVYVLHSGVHIYYADRDKDYAAKVLRRELQDRGIRETDLVVIPNPFPTASKEDRFPRDGLLMFLDASDPKSKFSQDAYRRFDKALADAKVCEDARIVWIGYSAGGQVGMTMAYLANHLHDYPELAKAAKKRTFEAVFAIGFADGDGYDAGEREALLLLFAGGSGGAACVRVHAGVAAVGLRHDNPSCPLAASRQHDGALVSGHPASGLDS